MKRLVLTLLLIRASTAGAVESALLTVGKITAADWSLENVALSLSAIDRVPAQWSLGASALRLPAPFQTISAVDIACGAFQWGPGFMRCDRGRGRIDSKQLRSPAFDFSLEVYDRRGTIRIKNLQAFGGNVSLIVREQDGNWQLEANGRRIELHQLQAMVGLTAVQSIAGTADLTLSMSGRRSEIRDLSAKALLNGLTLQAGSKIASEGVGLKTTLKASRHNKAWRWRNELAFEQGGIYIEPIYWQAQPQQAITLATEGTWLPQRDEIELRSARLTHPGAGELEAAATFAMHSDKPLRRARVDARILDLSKAAPVYLLPFLEAGPFAGLQLGGRMTIGLTVDEATVNQLNARFEGLQVDDPEQRFQVLGADGNVAWRPRAAQGSRVAWRRLKLKAIPIEAGHLSFTVEGRRFALRRAAEIPLLGGELLVEQFSVAADSKDDADVHFSGSLKSLSLERLSRALDWTPLSGEMSGRIPSVTYRNKTLELNGKLTMQVFGGEVTVTELASSGMFTDFAQFYADIDVANLDLNAITRKFAFGSIDGRLSGYAHNLYLENWRPVSFYAWFGTPDDDDSRHRISQKAVENIASIGGGGAADAISRGFLRFFDNFGYDKLGFGCYLHNGVCQMMGVGAADNGYYLVKGGGLPRIDVIGYNPRLDWNVLLQRLRRITATDNAVVE